MKEDKWKEAFLKEINDKAQLQTVFQGRGYTVYGLPFYNSGKPHLEAFEKEFSPFVEGVSE